MNLARALLEKTPVAHEKTAIRFNDQKTTYKELRQQVERSTAALHQLGIAKGDRVALLLPKGVEFIELNLAAFGPRGRNSASEPRLLAQEDHPAPRSSPQRHGENSEAGAARSLGAAPT